MHAPISSLVSVFLLIFLVPSYGADPHDSLDRQTLSVMQELMGQYQLPSLSVAIGLNNEVVFSEAIGHANIDGRVEANSRTQYSVGSLAKPMTGIAMARLIDTGHLDLDSLVSTYVTIPEYTSTFTLRELASHIAGVPHDAPERDTAEFHDTKDHQSPFEAFYVFESHPLLFPPGTEYGYSSNGYILLSAVIEAASETGYVDVLRDKLWSRYGMNLTELDTSTAGVPHEATYYSELGDDGAPVESSDKRDRSFLFGGGGFISTPTDMVKMARATYDGEYLSNETRHQLYTPTRLRNGETNSDNYSLGWRVGSIRLNEDGEETRTVLHHGGITDNASTAFLLAIPECKTSISFATNFVPERFWQVRGVMANILKKYTNADQCSKAENKKPDETAEILARFETGVIAHMERGQDNPARHTIEARLAHHY